MKKNKSAEQAAPRSKIEGLEPYLDDPTDAHLTTDQGIRIASTDDSLKAGERGPTLLEDFHFREKTTHFDHERIPERVVHARGSGAHGYFQVYASMAAHTRARFLQDPSVKTPVFVRFSTVVGSRGSADTARDVRGFATKFYTDEGNFDLVGNNIPVFFIQDGIKFADVVHAVKPEPHHEIPQASSAHDTFWDFVSLVPETAHMVMWLMSDRAIPRSFRMMEGFGVHTFRLVNAQGEATLVKFHWKPLLGVHALVWDEAQKLGGKDPDFHRRDLWEAIEAGHFPEYELGVQLIAEDDVLAYGFDLLDATKILPEELVPVKRIGKLTLDRNPTNFFAETEQVAFHIGNVVPGIDFTNDPLLQARLFSYLDTQLTRLGGPNFAEIPINRPLAPVHNHQQDGLMRQRILATRANYTPNSIAGGCPMTAAFTQGGFVHHAEKVDGQKIRKRSESFGDHFSQAALFFHSLSLPEQRHLVEALQFELGKVERAAIRERVVREILAKIDGDLAAAVALAIDVAVPSNVATSTSAGVAGGLTASPALSMESTPHDSIKSRRVAVLVADGFDGGDVAILRAAFEPLGATIELVAPRLGAVTTKDGGAMKATRTFLTADSILFDAVFVPGGADSSATLQALGAAVHFIEEAYRHAKPIGAAGEGVSLLDATAIVGATLADPTSGALASDLGVVTVGGPVDKAFLDELEVAVAQHRHWTRGDLKQVPA